MQDLRLALRSLRATPVVSLVAVLSLALGIGANTAIFSLVNSLLLRALPVVEPQRLVTLHSWDGKRFNRDWMYETWNALRTRAQNFDGAFATGEFGFRLTHGGEVQQVDGAFASGEFFSTLGVRPVLGRFFTSTDDVRGGGPDGPVAVISYGLWQQRLGGDPAVIGKPLMVDAAPFTIIGVTPPSFFGVEVGRAFDVFLPLETEPLVHVRSPMIGSPDGPMWLRVMLRLKPGDSIEHATAVLRGLQPTIRETGMPPALDRFPDAKRQFLTSPFVLASAMTGSSYLRTEYTRPLLALFVIVALVLLIACANIANLQLARATARRHEMSVRRALGASRWRLARQLLIESLLVATIGAAGGFLIAMWGSRVLVAQLTSIVERVTLDLSIDWHVLAFTAAVTMVTAMIFGMAPAWRTSRVEPIEALKEQGRQTGAGLGARASVSSGLVVVQVALTLVLLVVAGLFIRTFERLAHASLGFDSDRLLVVNVSSSSSTIEVAGRIGLYQRLVDAATAVPGVSHAAGSIMAPFGLGASIQIRIPAEAPAGTSGAPLPKANFYVTTPGWIATYGLALRAGRDLATRDSAHAPLVMLVNEAFVRKFMPSGRALDQRVGLSIVGSVVGTRTIVGVVSDAIGGGSLREAPLPTIYLPMTQWDMPIPILPRMYVTVRAPAGTPPATLTGSVTAALKAVDRQVGLTPHVLETDVRRSFAQERLIAMLAGGFGALALLLAAIGLYGVTAYAVGRRKMEIGIRLALGATPAGVIRLVLSRVAWLVAIGVAVGAAASAWIGQFATPLLFGVTARDPATLAIAAATLAIIGAVAGGLPASRASGLDPARVLRAQ
jgi:putative ABC transport system permease protein